MNNRQQFGAIVLSILLIAAGGFTALSAAKGATDGMNGDDNGEMSEGDSVFPDPVVLSFAGITIEVGPPMDNDGDGVYEDLNGDGELTVFDAVLHAVVVTAVEKGELDLASLLNGVSIPFWVSLCCDARRSWSKGVCARTTAQERA